MKVENRFLQRHHSTTSEEKKYKRFAKENKQIDHRQITCREYELATRLDDTIAQWQLQLLHEHLLKNDKESLSSCLLVFLTALLANFVRPKPADMWLQKQLFAEAMRKWFYISTIILTVYNARVAGRAQLWVTCGQHMTLQSIALSVFLTYQR